jgi:Fe-Mn family superoxide dismutase
MAFELPNLPYAQDALEPHIDAKTMGIHHGKHHNGYTTKLNAALEGHAMAGKSIEDILKNMDMNNAGLRNNGGGYYNHSLFWSVMSLLTL